MSFERFHEATIADFGVQARAGLILPVAARRGGWG
jgi:hypothetical protein